MKLEKLAGRSLRTRLAGITVVAAAALGALAVAAPRIAHADDPAGADGLQSGPHAPPQEAFDACTSHAAGDACTVQLGPHSMTGTCTQSSDRGLFCRPDHPPAPPPEAFSACSGLSSGATCSVSMHGHTMSGTCDTPPGESRLACRPDHGPGGSDGPPR